MLIKISCFILLGFFFIPFDIYTQVNFTSSNLPVISINTNGQEILDDPRIIADMGIIFNGEGNRNNISDPFNDYDGKISIEVRGSTSQSFPKKQYGLETQDEDGNNNNVSLLGMPEENDWILNGPYSDKSLIRNALIFQLAREMGHYAPRTMFCELVLNGDYMGVYVLTEKIKRDINRVNISSLGPEDISGDELTGGYILKIDKSIGSSCDTWYSSIGNILLQVEYPICENIVGEQKQYIKQYINDFENVLFSEFYTDTLIGYRGFINVNSFIDYLILNEISKNIDAYKLSTFLYKDRNSIDGELKMGPIWDYNIAFGNANYNNGNLTDDLLVYDHVWWNRLLQDTSFSNSLKKRWKEVRENQLSNEHLIYLIDSMATYLNEAQDRNFTKWDNLGSRGWPNFFAGPTYESEISFLKGWLINRINWLDNHMPGIYKDYKPYIDYEVDVFPNPFLYFLTYKFTLEQAANVSITIYESQGKLVHQLIDNEYFEPGVHKTVWNGNTGKQSFISDGIYIIALEIDGEVISSKKIVKRF